MNTNSGPLKRMLYMHAPSLFLDLYIGSSILANRYIERSISLTSLINYEDFRNITMDKLLKALGSRIKANKVLDNLRYTSLISSIDAAPIVKEALSLINLIKDYERSHSIEMVKWYSRVMSKGELPYSKVIYSLKHTIKITRGMVKHYLYRRAPSMLRKTIIDSLMIYAASLPDLLMDYLNLTSKSDSITTILVSALIDRYRVTYPIHLMFRVLRRVLLVNPALLRLILNEMIMNLPHRSSYHRAILAELAKMYIYDNGSLDELPTNYALLDYAMDNDLIVKHSTELVNSLSPIIYDYIYKLSLLTINGDSDSLRKLSELFGGIDEGLIKLILGIWRRLNDEFSNLVT